MANQTPSAIRRTIIMFALIAAGEAVFLLPFVVPRIFRPTVLDVFGLTNLELGLAFSVYGIVAMVSYFAGGPLADRFSARRLITVALVTTSFGGIFLAAIPSFEVLTVLYGYWGLTTILLFWAALIRATREWGGDTSQGKAYGLLDGGRGLFAALLASFSVAIFALLLPSEVESASMEERTYALSRIIWFFSGLILTIAALVWFSVPEGDPVKYENKKQRLNLEGIRAVIKMPAVWLQAVIVICAYVGYKCTDDFSLYARDALGYNEVLAAQVGTISYWTRPFAAIGAGILGDRFGLSRTTLFCFGILLAGSLFIALGLVQAGIFWMLAITIAGTSAGIYSLRGLYFALFQEADVPLIYTGSAVGLVSVIGYTPDVFMGPLMGVLIDNNPGALGHQYVFGVLAGFALLGMAATFLFQRVIQKPMYSPS